MSLSLEGCALIESQSGDLANYLKMAEDFMNWTSDERASYIVKLCAEYLSQIDDIRVSSDDKELPECWPLILKSWLMGQNPTEILANNDLPSEWRDAMKISTFIDDLCDFRLPWGLNALSLFWQNSTSHTEESDTAIEEIDEISFVLPEIVNYFASMLRFGVYDPIATIALALGLGNRKAALCLSKFYTGTIDETNILRWIQLLDPASGIQYSEDPVLQNIVNDFISLRQLRNRQLTFPLVHFWEIEDWKVLEFFRDADVIEGMPLINAIDQNNIHLYTPDGDYLGILIYEDFKELQDISQYKDLLSKLEKGIVSINVMKINQRNGDIRLDLQIS